MNKRAISITNVISKLAESIKFRLLKFCKTNWIIGESQFSFREERPTNGVTHNVIEFICKSVDSDEKC